MRTTLASTRGWACIDEGCGLRNVALSWGHDEYMYHRMKDYLPEPALYMIRFHSFYAWHREGEYDYLCDDHDRADAALGAGVQSVRSLFEVAHAAGLERVAAVLRSADQQVSAGGTGLVASDSALAS